MTGLLSMSLDDIMSEARRAIIQGKKKVEAVADKAGGTEWEMKLKSATSLDNWNPSSSKLNILAQGTYDPGIYREIVPLLWQRVAEKPKYWRIVWKALNVVEYFIRHGSERFINEAKDKTYTIQMLQNFNYVDSEEKDRGAGIRQKAKEIVELLEDDMKIRQLRETAVKNANKFTSLSSGEGGLGSSAAFDSYSAGGNSSSSAAGKYGGYEGGGDDSAFDHPAVTDATSNHESKIDYSDIQSADFTTRNRKGKGKGKKVVAGAEHNGNAEFVNEAFDNFEDAFERDLHLSQKSQSPSASPQPTTASSAGAPSTFVDNGYGSDHDTLKSNSADNKNKKKKKKRVVANKAVVNISGGKLAPPPGSSSNGTSKSTTVDILSFYEDKDTSTSSAKPAATKPTLNADDFLSFDDSTPSTSNSTNNIQPSLFDQLAARATSKSTPPTNKQNPDDLFAAFGAPSSSSPLPQQQQQQHPHHQQRQPSLGRIPSVHANNDSWNNDLVSLNFNKPAGQPYPSAFGAAPRQPSYSQQHGQQQHHSQSSFGFPPLGMPQPHEQARQGQSSPNAQDVFFGSLSSNAEKISMPPQRQRPQQQQPSSHDPFADLLK